jgi:hypothetical protein
VEQVLVSETTGLIGIQAQGQLQLPQLAIQELVEVAVATQEASITLQVRVAPVL